jgi:hypothetical protein
MPNSAPDKLRHYIGTDHPLLTFHITSFTDATLVSIMIPYLLSDAVGASILLKAWSSVLANGTDLVPDFLGAREDILEIVETPTKHRTQPPSPPRNKQITGLRVVAFAIGFALDLFTKRNVRARTIFFPHRFMAMLRQRAAQEQLKHGRGPVDGETPAFVSDGDIITAWLSRMIMFSRSRPHPTSIVNAFDLRSRIDGIEGCYVQNLLEFAVLCLPREESGLRPFGEIASTYVNRSSSKPKMHTRGH